MLAKVWAILLLKAVLLATVLAIMLAILMVTLLEKQALSAVLACADIVYHKTSSYNLTWFHRQCSGHRLLSYARKATRTVRETPKAVKMRVGSNASTYLEVVLESKSEYWRLANFVRFIRLVCSAWSGDGTHGVPSIVGASVGINLNSDGKV